MEQILKEILTEIKGINKRLETLEEGQKQLFEGQTSIVQRLDKLDNRVDNLEGQMIETNGIVKALRHNQEEMNAELHNLGHDVNQLNGRAARIEETQKENFERIETKVDILTHRVMANDGEIQLLKKVK